MSEIFDVVVIGGGPAGVTAALRARELGASVALVERGAMGGTCTNDGCAPTRVLAKAARLVRDAEQFANYGLRGAAPTVDFAALTERTRAIIGQLHAKKELSAHLAQVGVTLFDNAGAATFASPQQIVFGDQHLDGRQFIICAGGHARRLDFPGSELTLSHSDVWTMRALPRSIAIIGGSATGCQLASIFNAFGSAVTLLDLAPRILPTNDAMISQTLSAAFERRGMRVVTGLGGVKRVTQGKTDGLELFYAKDNLDQQLAVDAVLLAVGWPGNADQLNLAAAGVASERGYIKVDSTLRSSQPHIFAAGDITGRMMLVQGATDEARAAAQNAVLGRKRAHEHRVVPSGGFTDPEYGSVGLSEERAREQHEVVVVTVPYADLDRAVIDGRADGFCKLIVSRETHAILGAHVVGEQAVEIVHIVAALMQAHSTIERLAQLEIAYPTFAAVVGLAARQLARELGTTPVAAEWGSSGESVAAEWERS